MSTIRVNTIQDTGTNTAATISGGTVTFNNPPINVGVSNLQMFRINSDLTSATSLTLITNYTDAHDTFLFKRIGTAWTVNSGIFAPGDTGVYEISLVANLRATSNNRYIQFNFYYSTDSGANFTNEPMYTHLAHLNSGTTYNIHTSTRTYNVTDSNFRFQIKWLAEGTNITLAGHNTNNVESRVIIKRLADAQ